ncbi:unnamed protein product [Camellia sinensis]
MADSEHSSSDETSFDSSEESSKKTEHEFSEDEETLIIRMYNLVGERLALFFSIFFHELFQIFNNNHDSGGL